MINSVMVKETIFEGRYVLSIRDGKAFVKDTKNDTETELATANIEHYVSSGTISSSGEISLYVKEITEPVKFDISSYTKNAFVAFDGKYGPEPGDVPQNSEAGHYLTWSGSGWFLDAPPVLPNTPDLSGNPITDLQNVESGTITQGSFLIGSGNNNFKIHNPQSVSTSSSGYLKWDNVSGYYKLQDILETINYENGKLKLIKTDGSETDLTINPVSIFSPNLGAETAQNSEFLVWNDTIGQWDTESRIHQLSDANKDETKLITASGVYKFTDDKINALLTGGNVSLNITDISASGSVTTESLNAKTIVSNDVTLSSGGDFTGVQNISAKSITISSGSNGSIITTGSGIEVTNGNIELTNGNITGPTSIATFDTINGNKLSASEINSTTSNLGNARAQYLLLSGSGKSITYASITKKLEIDFDSNNSYYYNSINIGINDLENLEFKNGVLGSQAVISLYGSGTVKSTIKYINDNVILYKAPIAEDIQITDTTDVLITVHYSRNDSTTDPPKPVYYIVISGMEKVI